MSEMEGSGTAIPNNVNLSKQKPQAIQCYNRRVKSIATNSQQFGENQYIKIYLDTSVPGASIDPLSSYLSWTIQILNTNPFVDYVSFGSAGVASFIDEYRVYNQGTPIVEMLQYNVLYELLMDLSGICRKPYYMYRSCNVTQGVEKVHSVNAIKPPMVNQQGNPMHYMAVSPSHLSNSSVWGRATNTQLSKKPYLLATCSGGASFHRLQVTTPVSDELNTATLPYASNWARPYVPVELPSLLMGRMAPNALPLVAASGKTVNSTSWGSFYSDASGNLTNSELVALGTTARGNNSNSRTTTVKSAIIEQTAVTTITYPMDGIQVFSDITDCQINALSAGAPPAVSLFGSTTYFMNSSDTVPENPLNWPFVMPNDLAYQQDSDPVLDLQSYFMFYSNVKNIPIGVIGQPRSSSLPAGVVGTTTSNLVTNQNFINTAELGSTANIGTSSYTFTSSLPLICPIFGSLADKCAPTMLMAPGSTYIEIKTAQATKALQVSMDPCRRVLGTIRDYIPFGGSVGGVYGQFNYVNPVGLQGTTTATDFKSERTLAAMVNSLLTNMQYLPAASDPSTSTSGPAVAQTPWQSNAAFGIGSGVISNGTLGDADYSASTQTGLTAAGYGRRNAFSITSRPMPLPNFACIGANMAPIQYYIAGNPTTGLQATYDLIFSPYSPVAMNGQWTTYSTVHESMQTMMSSSGGLYTHGSVSAVPQYLGGSVNFTTLDIDSSATVTQLMDTDTPGIGPSSINSATISANNQPMAVYGQNVIFSQSPNTGVYNSDVFSYDYAIPSGSAQSDSSTWGMRMSAQVAGSGGVVKLRTYNRASTSPVTNQVNFLLQELTVCGHSAGIPMPQYYLVKTPWLKKNLFVDFNNSSSTTSAYRIWGATVGLADIASETQACYGTFLERSVAQSLRCFNSGNTDYVTYLISNVEYVAQQIILPEAISAAILRSAANGDISVATTGIRCYQSQVNSSVSQNIIVSAKIGSANAIYSIFQPQNYQAGTEAQLYNSMSRMCPFSKIYSADANPQTTAISVPTVTSLAAFTSGKYAIGQSVPFTYINTSATKGAFKLQLMIGNELVPQQPITSISEVASELIKCQHKLFDLDARSDLSMNIVNSAGYNFGASVAAPIYSFPSSSTASSFYYDCMHDRSFCAAFTPAAWLDDQTYVGNPNWNYIGACLWNMGASVVNGTAVGGGLTNTAPISTDSLYGARGAYCLQRFTPLESSFVYGTDLDTWSKYSNVSRSGKFLGQNTIYLQMDGAIALDYLSGSSATTGITGINCYNFIPHDLRLSFQAGGAIVAFY